MTPSEQIEADLKREIAHGAETHITPHAYYEWLRESGITWAAVSAVTGADKNAARDKLVAGNPFATKSTTNIEHFSRPMTREHFPGDPELWEVGKPKQLLMKRLSEALDSADWWRNLYLEAKGAEPDAEGLTWWKARVRKLFIEGI